MFRIRKIYDDTSAANRDAIEQVKGIMRKQFPLTRKEDLDKIVMQLHDPVRYRYRSVLFVGENAAGVVKGFAMMLHMPDLNIGYLELLSAAPGATGGGVGGALYEHVREEANNLGVRGLFFECSVDDPAVVTNPVTLKQNQERLRFYERYRVFPILNNVYASPVHEGDQDLYFLMHDPLGKSDALQLPFLRKVVKAILDRKYGKLLSKDHIEMVAQSFKDDPLLFRAPRYIKRATPVAGVVSGAKAAIALIVNAGHDIHHVRDIGYMEAPVRIPVIMRELAKTSLFHNIKPERFSSRFIKQVHDSGYVEYLRRACESLPAGKSIYPIIFPLRNKLRPPKDSELQVGYYCMDTFTPLNRNAYIAARNAVNCALTGATKLLDDYSIAYALVRPPGHHAETRAFGGFCYFNSAAVAANYLSSYGRVAVLDIDFHHGNGTQDIFYSRSDVLTISIHGHPHFAYPHFSGFADEKGEGEGEGYNVNYPLPEACPVERYQRTLEDALKRVARFKPAYLVIALGLDTAKADPTGSWALGAKDFHESGRLVGALGLPMLVVQEGGYRTRTLGINVRNFFSGVWQGYSASKQRLAAPARR